PRFLEALAALGIAQLPAHRHLLRIRHARERPARLFAIGGAVGFEVGLAIVGRRTVMCGQGEVRRALEHREMRSLFRDQRNRLDARGSRADHGDALACEIDAVMWPASGEMDLALELLDAVDLRRLWRGETAGGHDVVAAGYARAPVGDELPALAG